MLYQTSSLPANAARKPTVGELISFAESLGFPVFAGLELAARADQLRVGEIVHAGETVLKWAFSDASQHHVVTCPVNRYGRPQANTSRGFNFAGVDESWPIGVAELETKRLAAVCDSVADTLAIWSLAWFLGKTAEIAPVYASPEGGPIHLAARGFFHGKGVWLFSKRIQKTPFSGNARIQDLNRCGAAWIRSGANVLLRADIVRCFPPGKSAAAYPARIGSSELSSNPAMIRDQTAKSTAIGGEPLHKGKRMR